MRHHQWIDLWVGAAYRRGWDAIMPRGEIDVNLKIL